MKSVGNFSIKHKNKNWLKILIGVVALLFLIWVLNIFVSPIKNAFYNITSPIQKTFWLAGASSSNFFGSLFNGVGLSQENQNLKFENQKLLSQIAALQSIEQGNQAQSDVSSTCQNTGFKLVMAGVSGLNNDILSINKGSADKIAEGMPVISQQGVLFGEILKVYKKYSDVMLITNKNSVVNVKVQQGDIALPETDGVVKGNGGLSAYLDLIPIDSSINSGDVLVTSALDKSFPKDLLVAKITQIQKNDQKPFQQAQVSLFLDVKTVNNLFVITNYKR